MMLGPQFPLSPLGNWDRLVFLSCGHKPMSVLPLGLLVMGHSEEHAPQSHQLMNDRGRGTLLGLLGVGILTLYVTLGQVQHPTVQMWMIIVSHRLCGEVSGPAICLQQRGALCEIQRNHSIEGK